MKIRRDERDDDDVKIDKVSNGFISKKKGKRKKKGQGPIGQYKTPHVLHILPWASKEEWEEVCSNVHQRNYKSVVGEIGIWQARVPSLPIAPEATLYVLQAKCYDDQRHCQLAGKSYDGTHASALYCLALVRHLNHVGNVAATAFGADTSMPTKELTSSLGTPDWLVSLRNEVSHGTTVPSIEILRLAGDFIINWLKENYWIPSNETTPMIFHEKDVLDAEEISELVSAFIAARVYKVRGIHTISDSEVTKFLKSHPHKANTKAVILELKSKLLGLLRKHTEFMCSIFSQEMIPNSEFYSDFKRILRDVKCDTFDQLTLIWSPITKDLLQMDKFPEILLQLVQIHIDENSDETSQELSAKWIAKMLEILNETGRQHTDNFLKLLRLAMSSPNRFSSIFLSKLTGLLENKLGSETVSKLQKLAGIWISKWNAKDILQNGEEYFTIDDIHSRALISENVNHGKTSWYLDARGSSFWKNIPIGTILGSNQ